MTDINIPLPPLPPIESDDGFERHYIPIAGGWEIQTKGRGSSFRIADSKPNGIRFLVFEQPYIFGYLEKMARESHAAHAAALEQNLELRLELNTAERHINTLEHLVAKGRTFDALVLLHNHIKQRPLSVPIYQVLGVDLAHGVSTTVLGHRDADGIVHVDRIVDEPE